MKKILSVLLCICMVLTLITATVMASGTDKVYINGTVTLSTVKPATNEELEYYLVGMINNSDHYEKEYKFIDGKIEFKFTSDSYVAVMDSEENIYWTDGWLDFDPTEATLKRSGDNKMHISPKSDNCTLWLTVNDDGTLTLTTYEPIKTYTVTFDANGYGEAPDAIEAVNDGNKITAPAAPTAEGYNFGGWYKEATCENAWDFDNDTVTADTTLYALWTPVIVDSTPADLPDTVNEKGPSKIWINNIKLENGDYLATNEATEASENYTNGTPYVAVYKNGILYLNNINIENNANGESSSDEDHAIYWKAADNDDLIIELIEGTTNNISDGKWSAINGADGGGYRAPSLTIQGNGTLNVSCADNAIWVWDGTTIQNGATVNITCGGTGISNNDRSGKIVVKSGTTLNISGDDHAIKTDNNRTGTFYVEGGDITLKGNTSAIYHLNCDFGNIPVYVSENVSGEGATLWDGTTDITTYKYVSLSGTRTEGSAEHNDSHTICGDGSCTDTNHAITWTEWTSTNSLPTTSGNYYLANDVIVSSSYFIDNANVNLCLNGHKVDLDTVKKAVYILEDNATLSICDCRGTGTIGGNACPVSYYGSNSTFNLYSGTLISDEVNTINETVGNTGTNNKVNIYGGNVKGKLYPTTGTKNTVITIYKGNFSAEQTNGILLLEGNRLNLCGNPVITGSSLTDNTLNNDIKTYVSDAIDATGYTGDTLTVYYAKDGRQVGDVVVKNITDETESKFVLSEANEGYMLNREGNNLIYVENPAVATYTVTFDANGHGEVPEAIENVEEGSKITAPTSPVAEGFTFDGWYKEATCENEWDFENDTVTDDITLYAKWTEAAEEPETYTVTFDANGGNVSPESAETEEDGKLATLPTPTKSGNYRFNGWFTAASGGTEITTDTVFIEDSTIYAQWTYTGSSGGGSRYYNVTFNTNGGSKLASQRLRRNAVATEPEEPTKDGYTFDGWCTDKELTTAYDFDTKVTKSFTLYAKWVEAKATHVCPSEKFSDLDTTKWYHEDIDYVLDNEIMLGTSDTVFAPEENLTRGMLVTILYRSEGEPATNRSIPFADVDMGAYYANAVVWAQQNGIVKGISETEYAPEMSVTREQLATIMLRYAQFKGMDAVTTEENLGFNDASDISDWAVAAMNWGVGRDYIFSRTEGSIAPKVAATRAEIAAFIHRYIVDTAK